MAIFLFFLAEFEVTELETPEIGDQSSLVLFQHELGKESSDSLHVEQLDNIDFVCKSLAGLFMPL